MPVDFVNGVHYNCGVNMGTVVGISERREKEKKEMRQAILDAAMSLFVEEGFDSVSIRKIADKIEYSPSTIYLYFEDKDAIFFELHNIGFAELYKHQMETQNIQDPKERLIAHGRAYLGFALEHTEYYDIMFIARASGIKIKKESQWFCGDRSFELLRTNILDCMSAGYFKGHNVDAVAFVFWSMMHGMIALHIRNRLLMFDAEEKGIDISILFDQAMGVLNSFIA